MMRKLFSIIIIGLMLMTSLVVVIPNSVKAEETLITVYVDNKRDDVWYEDPYNFNSIKSATHFANNERDKTIKVEEVYVFNGTYYESDIEILFVSYDLIGENKYNTIIDGAYGGVKDFIIDSRKSGVNISGFTIKHGKDCGVLVSASNTEISDNIFIENGKKEADYDYGAGITIGGEVQCEIHNNIIKKSTFGIKAWDGKLTIYENHLIENVYGIYFNEGVSNSLIYHNNFIDNYDPEPLKIAYRQADDRGSGNIWYLEDNDGETGEGNYWSDYEQKYPRAIKTGNIWSDPYRLLQGAGPDVFDKYPLVDAYGEFPPEKPVIEGPKRKVSPGDEITFTAVTTDLDGDNTIMEYVWNWTGGFGKDESTSGPTALHSWSEKGTFTVRVQAIDNTLRASEWSDPFSVTVDKAKSISYFIEFQKNPLFEFLFMRINSFFNLIKNLQDKLGWISPNFFY